MELKTFLYDAFSSKRFGGNVAGVVILEEELKDADLQALAAEINAPTTGFVRMHGKGAYHVRFFSPTSEMDLCGHVTIGVACALFDEGLIQQGKHLQHTAAGDIPLDIDIRENRPHVRMTQRLPQFGELSVAATDLVKMMGIGHNALHTEIVPGMASTGLTHLFVALKSVNDLETMHCDDVALTEFSRKNSIHTMGVFALTSHEGNLRLRDLCHGVGNPEESASGTTNGALACFLFRRGVWTTIDNTVTQIAQQGVEMGRPSTITTQLTLQGSDIVTVQVGGTAVPSLIGTLNF